MNRCCLKSLVSIVPSMLAMSKDQRQLQHSRLYVSRRLSSSFMPLAVFWKCQQLAALGSAGRASPFYRTIRPNSLKWKLDSNWKSVSRNFSRSQGGAFSARDPNSPTLASISCTIQAMGKQKKGGKHKNYPDDQYIVKEMQESSISTAGVDGNSSSSPMIGKATVDFGGTEDGGSASSSPRAGREVRKLALARVVAAFYPKFENESADMEVREKEYCSQKFHV